MTSEQDKSLSTPGPSLADIWAGEVDVGYLLWLDADDSTSITRTGTGDVTAWNDKSGDGYIADAIGQEVWSE